MISVGIFVIEGLTRYQINPYMYIYRSNDRLKNQNNNTKS
jgi:hypothetical protein